MNHVDVWGSVPLKTVLKSLFWVGVVAYLALPVYLYAFTPMGASVLQMVQRVANREKPVQAREPISPVPTVEAQAEAQPTPAKEAPLSVLLLGYGGPGHDGAYLTDSIILAIADPKSKSLSLLSIPRDTLVNLQLGQEGGTWSKINTAYAYGIDDNIYPRRPARYKGQNGAGNLAKDAVSGVVGFPVRYYVALDFNAFRKFIDEIGGVDVTVEAAFSSLYPRSDDPSVDDEWMVVSFDAGKQHMDGEKALKYSRAREAIDNMAEGSDFARSRRQRQVMQSFKDKVMSPSGLIHIPGLLAIAKERVSTDVEIPGMSDLNQLIADWRGVKITEVALTSDNYLSSEASTASGYYLSPVLGQNDWSQIHTFVNILLSDPPLAVELARTKVVLRNGTGDPEEGKQLRAKLMAQGFAVAPVETVAAQETTRIEDMSGGNAPHLIESLKAALGKPDLPVQSGGYPSPRVAIIIGKD